MIRLRMKRLLHLASLACFGAAAACSSDTPGGSNPPGGNASSSSSGSAAGGAADSGAGGGEDAGTGASSSSSGGSGAMDDSGSGASVGNDAGTSSGSDGGGAGTGDDAGTSSGAGSDGGDASTGTGAGGTGQFTITFDATPPGHFGPEHAGLTAYAEIVDTTGGKNMQVGDIYSSPMTATGYAKWVWKNFGVSGHTYTYVIFDDAATMNPTCKAADAGWTIPVNGGKPLTADSTYVFKGGPHDPNHCTWFPMGPITGAVPVPTPL
jgi:hypothetical protein